MCAEHVRTVAIVGGGPTGWLVAAALTQAMKDRSALSVHVIEDPLASPESMLDEASGTLPPLRTLHRILGFDERHLMRSTQATFSLGTRFVDFSAPGSSYYHAFGELGSLLESIAFHQHWLRARQADDFSIDAYSLSAVAAEMGRFSPPSSDPRSVLSTLDYGYHIDAALYAEYLRRHAQGRGVVRTEGKVVDVRLRAQDGFIDAVVLESGERVTADLFVDCSGLRGLLIEQALHAGYEDWSHWLPCDRAVTVPCASAGDPPPYTRSTARSAGWQWRIPLQHRIGNGYVYCSQHLNDEEAAATLLTNLDGAPLGEPRFLRFTTGRRKQFWVKNCVAIGLAAGFMEPLESTSIHLIQSGIAKLLALFPYRDHMQRARQEYNRLATEDYERIRDFLILHYYLNARTDSLWERCRSIDLPSSLQRKLDVFGSCGRVVLYDEETFLQSSWVSVLIGCRRLPKRYDLIADTLDETQVRQQLRRMKSAIDAAAQSLSSHHAFLNQYLAATSSR
jgi:tryptophan 7-halogenase